MGRSADAALGLALLALACNNGLPPEAPHRSGLHLQAECGDDVTEVRVRVERVACSSVRFEPLVREAVAPTQDRRARDTGPRPAPGRRFADAFMALPAGWYDVVATPEGDARCAPAHARAVRVVDGLTTELLLVSPCDGDGRGALDTATWPNHPPRIDALSYRPSRSVACGEEVTICVTASDRDRDRLEMVWHGALAAGATREVPQRGGGTMTECLTLTAATAGAHELEVRVYDLVEWNDEVIPVEEHLAEQGEPVASHDALRIPLHVDRCEREPSGGVSPAPDEVDALPKKSRGA